MNSKRDNFDEKIFEFNQLRQSLKFQLKTLIKEHIKNIVIEQLNKENKEIKQNVDINKLNFVKIDNFFPGPDYQKIYSDLCFTIWLNQKINRIKYVDMKKLNKMIKIYQE